MSLFQKLLISVCPTLGISYGFQLILRFEGTGVGLQWSTLFESVSSDDSLTIGYLMGMMIFDSILYMTLALYFEKILPFGSTSASKWYFPVTMCFKRKYDEIRFDLNQETNSNNIEEGMESKRAGISIMNLKKVYSNGKVALKRLNMQMYEDQITVLLGHNGAGKSTLISTLTGLTSPTSGTVRINGFDIMENIEAVRESFGLCLQHNILFDDLTVKEHLIFYRFVRVQNYVRTSKR